MPTSAVVMFDQEGEGNSYNKQVPTSADAVLDKEGDDQHVPTDSVEVDAGLADLDWGVSCSKRGANWEGLSSQGPKLQTAHKAGLPDLGLLAGA